MAGERILIIEDDSDIREILKLRLNKEGYKIIEAEDGETGINLAELYKPELIILDIMLPGIDGYEVCRNIKRKGNIPVIFLSCKDEDEDKIAGLTLGGDDYITKPFSMGEFIARVRVQLRKNTVSSFESEITKSKKEAEKGIVFPGIEIYPESHRVLVNGVETELTNKEFKILVMLAENPNSVFSNEHIFNSIWGYDSYGDYRTIMVHMSNLRKKIESDPLQPEYIHTIKGVGYKFTNIRKITE
ncbi:MAG: response regulator transcription factor [Clostridia bacterium]|nr:response regulator transcription factor [Clostridia bacterium]